MGNKSAFSERSLVLFFENGHTITVSPPEDSAMWKSVPVGLCYISKNDGPNGDSMTQVDEWNALPIYTNASHNNLFGRMMTLVEAVIDTPERLKAVKSLMGKELGDFSQRMRMKVVYADRTSRLDDEVKGLVSNSPISEEI